MNSRVGQNATIGACLAWFTLLLSACALEPLVPGAIDASFSVGDPGSGDSYAPRGDYFYVEPGDTGGPYLPVTCRDDSLAVPEDRPAVPPAAGELVITEVFANPSGADLFADWFEILVTATDPVDLNDLLVTNDTAGEEPRELRLESTVCRTVQPGSYFVIGASEDPAQNRNAPVDWAPGLLQLFNDEGTLELTIGTTAVDTASLPTPDTGVSVGIDPSDLRAVANDSADDFCDAISTDVFDETGTPGRVNDDCPPGPSPGD